jgi:hypothetical protein
MALDALRFLCRSLYAVIAAHAFRLRWIRILLFAGIPLIPD